MKVERKDDGRGKAACDTKTDKERKITREICAFRRRLETARLDVQQLRAPLDERKTALRSVAEMAAYAVRHGIDAIVIDKRMFGDDQLRSAPITVIYENRWFAVAKPS